MRKGYSLLKKFKTPTCPHVFFSESFWLIVKYLYIVSLGKGNMSNYLHIFPKTLTEKLKIAKYYCISVFLSEVHLQFKVHDI